jgi:WD40 repeat protein
VSKDGNLLCAGSNIGAIVVWSLKEEGVPKRILTGHTNKVLCLAISRNGKLLASASKDKAAKFGTMKESRKKSAYRV